MGGAGVLGLAADVSFPVGEVVTNGPGVVGIGAQFQPKVGAGRGGVFGTVSNVAQIQLLLPWSLGRCRSSAASAIYTSL